MLGCLGGEAVKFWRHRRASVTWERRERVGRQEQEERGGERGQGGTGGTGGTGGDGCWLSAGCAPFAALGLPFAPCPSFRLPEQAFQDQAA